MAPCAGAVSSRLGGNNEPLKRADFRCWQIVLQSKIDALENSAKVDFLKSLKLENSVAPIGRSMVAFS
jgi:hypothetical protein